MNTKRMLMGLTLISVMMLTACPKLSQDKLDRAATASKAIATRYVEVVQFVDALYTSGAIKLDVKDKLALLLIEFGQNGKKFNSLLAAYSAQYKGSVVPPEVWTVVSTNFGQLSEVFLSILRLIPQAAGLADNAAFKIISAAVLSLAIQLAGVGLYNNLPELRRGVERYGLA